MRPGRPTCSRELKVPGTAWGDGNRKARLGLVRLKLLHCYRPIGNQQLVLPLPLWLALNLRRSESQQKERVRGEQRPCWMSPKEETM